MILTDTDIKALEKLAAYAKENPASLEDIKAIIAGTKVAPGDLPEFTVLCELGGKVVFTYEDQPAALCRHLSISGRTKGKMPNPGMAQAIMEILGFQSPMEDCKLWIEDIPDGGQAINILEVVL